MNDKKLSANEKETILKGVAKLNLLLDEFKQVETYREFDEVLNTFTDEMDSDNSKFEDIQELIKLCNTIQQHINHD